MTFRAFCLAKEKGLSSGEISRQGSPFAAALESTKIDDKRGQLLGTIRGECRHPLSGFSIGQNLEEFRIRLVHDFGAGHDIRSALNAARVKTMTRSACRLKNRRAEERRVGKECRARGERGH